MFKPKAIFTRTGIFLCRCILYITVLIPLGGYFVQCNRLFLTTGHLCIQSRYKLVSR